MPSVGSIFVSYNALLDRFAAREDLDALVLVHQDAEIVDADFCETIRSVLNDPDVGIVGCVGAVGVRSIAWWEASVTCASFINRYEEHGGGDLASFSWAWSEAPAYARVGEVETIDGFVLVLSPWVVRNVRFDESLGQFHGYDLDLCLQVRAAGRKVMTAGFRAIHHRQLEMVPDPEQWIDAHMKVADKWDGQMGIGTGTGSWEERARRRRGRHRRRLRDGVHERDRIGGPGARARARPRRDHLEHLLAADGAAAPAVAAERCRRAAQVSVPAPRQRQPRRRGRRRRNTVIAFGCAINNADVFRKYGEPGVRRAGEPDSELFAFAPVESVGRTYNLVLDAAARRDDLEALALVHPQTEIVDPGFCAKVREALADPEVGMVGCAGATGVTSIAWWEGRVVSAPAIHHYGEHGGGELPALSWTQFEPPPAEVEALDGQLLVLSPWVVRNLRFDENRLLGHGFDLDFSLQVRATGRKLMVADLRVVHHRSLELVVRSRTSGSRRTSGSPRSGATSSTATSHGTTTTAGSAAPVAPRPGARPRARSRSPGR